MEKQTLPARISGCHSKRTIAYYEGQRLKKRKVVTPAALGQADKLLFAKDLGFWQLGDWPADF
jgi:hypothetical protein